MLIFVLLLTIQRVDPLAVVVDPIRPAQDILHYDIDITIPDSGEEIRAATSILYRVHGSTGPLRLDFDDVFAIDSVIGSDGKAVDRSLSGNTLRINRWGDIGQELGITVYYHGAPADGLFIQDNVHGQRTVFADNWPNRAHHWFPSEDHPSDKATASFTIEVPDGWKAIANGRLMGIDTLQAGRSRWKWRTERRIPVYTMVIGAGPMAVTRIDRGATIDHTVWTFVQDSTFAIDGPFRRADEMVHLYERVIGPYPYAKLAHVQSSTRFGGMENSSAIFYSERGYANRTMGDGVVAHETAHQWFGDAVTEYDWHHLWLSEGFASYFDPVFFELAGDTARFREDMNDKKQSYLQSQVVDRPVIDTVVTNYFDLLNANNYPKGAWILHMLRGEVGDSTFFRGVREYYRTFRDSTALSLDLMRIMERHANRPLRWFFEQWLLQPGYPQLEVDWHFDEARRETTVVLHQRQPVEWGSFEVEVPIQLRLGAGEVLHRRVQFEAGARSANVQLLTGVPPADVRVDPSGTLLLTVGAGPRTGGS